MINLDTRVLELVNENELWLILHVAKRMQQNRMTAWPSLKTLCSDTKWSENALRKWRKSLCEKGFLSIEQRPAQTPIYRFSLKGIGVFSPLSGEFSEEDTLPKIGTPPYQKLVPPPYQKLVPPPYQKLVPELVSNGSELAIEVVSKEAPQAAAPPLPPNPAFQTPSTSVGEIGTLEAEKNKKNSFPAGPLSQAELSALEAQSVTEANEVFAAIQKPKAKRLPKTENDPADILAHLKGEAVEFFKAIREDWQRWTDYKRRDKKGNYRSAETEAVAVTRLFSLSAGRPDAAHEAIEHSIGNSYAGIYAPKQSDKRTAPAQRYSMGDCPQCDHTPDGLFVEMREFYKGNTGLMQKAQEYAGTRFCKTDLQTVVQKFCANQVSKGRIADTFEQHHAALTSWLMTQKKFEQPANSPMTSPLSSRPDGPQIRSAV